MQFIVSKQALELKHKQDMQGLKVGERALSHQQRDGQRKDQAATDIAIKRAQAQTGQEIKISEAETQNAIAVSEAETNGSSDTNS